MEIGNQQSAMLLVGLGNPGEEYEWTRHNLGFMLIDKLGRGAGVDRYRKECQSLVARADIEGSAVTLAKPQTYMNLSGSAVKCLADKLELSAGKNLIVISDDLALPFGTIRIRERGAAGGHNGLKSIIASFGTNEFIRLRIGIQPEHPITDAKKFVLDKFANAVRPAVEEILDRSAEAIGAILRDGPIKAMSRFNGTGE